MKINSKKLIPVLFVTGAVLILGGILLFAIGMPHASSTFSRVMQGIIATVLCLIGVMVLYYAYLSRDTDSNFFLYDRKTGRNIDPEDLDFDRVNARMGYFMTLIASSQSEAWEGNIFEETATERFGENEVYKPLVAYKMLYDLAETDTDDGWRLFTTADASLIDSLADALRDADEDPMPRTLIEEYNAVEDENDIEYIRDFIKGNVRYIRRRMMEYVRRNMNLFY